MFFNLGNLLVYSYSKSGLTEKSTDLRTGRNDKI